MKCLSLHQPWASLLVLGEKKIETRSWGTTHTGPLAVHASKWLRLDVIDLCDTEPFRSVLARHGLNVRTMPRGSVIGTVDLSRCLPILADGQKLPEASECIRKDEEGVLRVWHPFIISGQAGHSGDGHKALAEHEIHFGDYRPGRFGWVCERPSAFPVPVPLRGRQGLFTVDPLLLPQLADGGAK